MVCAIGYRVYGMSDSRLLLFTSLANICDLEALILVLHCKHTVI